MQSKPSLLLRLLRACGRLGFGLVLLAGLCLALSVQAQPAHAQSTLTVTDCSSDSQLQTDVSQANTDNDGDTITFSCGGDIKLSKTLTITGSMTIDGSGQTVTLDGQQQFGVFLVQSGANLTLNALTISNGIETFNPDLPGNLGGGLDNEGGTVRISNSTVSHNAVSSGGDGGGIGSNGGTLTISNSTVSSNSAGNGGGGIVDFGGTLTIADSTVSSNSAGIGGGIAIQGGTLTITQSTVSSNSSASKGGGIINVTATMSIANSTVSSNSASRSGGGIQTDFGGTTNISSSIIANNVGGNCAGSLTDGGFNLSSDGSCNLTGAGSLQGVDPKLGLLANNGGPTQTMALQQGSPAIDAGPPAGSCPATDQRGMPRPDNGEGVCDIGAYEFQDPLDNDLALSNVPANITANATSLQGAVVAYTAPTVVDEDSPLPSVSCSPASGSTFAITTTTVTCTVKDSDDTNSPVSASFTVTVNGAAAQVSDLITLVNSFGLPPDFQAGFDTQLQAVQTDLSNHNATQACHDLKAFTSHVTSQSGKGLTVSQANQLLAAATNIQKVLAC